MKIVVFGAAGRTGREVVTQALGHGDELTAFLRDPSALSVSHSRLHVVAGDVRDAGAVARALEGQDAAVFVIGSSGERPVTVYSEGVANILAGMEAAGVHRIVAVSSVGVGAPLARLPISLRLRASTVLKPVYEDMARMEAMLMASQAYWTIVRPAGLTEGRLTGLYRVVDGPLVPKGSRIARADLAAFILKALGQGSYVRHAVAVAY